MIRLIGQEAQAARAGKDARIIIKINSLIDPKCIDALYAASQAGVRVDLIVRGICGLKPGITGLSENVTVRSLLGRFLEHSRVCYFQNAPRHQRTYLGSPDWMPRNFFRRVEVAFPIEEEDQEASIIQKLEGFLKDNEFATELKGNGRYLKVARRSRKAFSIQEHLISQSIEESESEESEERLRRTSGKTENQGKGN
jgi:polyphosphate kinase